MITDATNLLLHGITNPAEILFALGATAAELDFVFGCLPSRSVLSLISAKIRRSA